jgi:hypothetical protein
MQSGRIFSGRLWQKKGCLANDDDDDDDDNYNINYHHKKQHRLNVFRPKRKYQKDGENCIKSSLFIYTFHIIY